MTPLPTRDGGRSPRILNPHYLRRCADDGISVHGGSARPPGPGFGIDWAGMGGGIVPNRRINFVLSLGSGRSEYPFYTAYPLGQVLLVVRLSGIFLKALKQFQKCAAESKSKSKSKYKPKYKPLRLTYMLEGHKSV